MKKTILLALFGLSSLVGRSQQNFKWEKVDTVNKTKSELYSDTKMFIAQEWKSAKDVIQNDDKESGMILVKGTTKESVVYMMGFHEFYFSYTVKFMVKDGKHKIMIDNVGCVSHTAKVNGKIAVGYPTLVGDNYPEEKGVRLTGLNEKRYLELMSSLKIDIQSIVDEYEKFIVKKTTTENW